MRTCRRLKISADMDNCLLNAAFFRLSGSYKERLIKANEPFLSWYVNKIIRGKYENVELDIFSARQDFVTDEYNSNRLVPNDPSLSEEQEEQYKTGSACDAIEIIKEELIRRLEERRRDVLLL